MIIEPCDKDVLNSIEVWVNTFAKWSIYHNNLTGCQLNVPPFVSCLIAGPAPQDGVKIKIKQDHTQALKFIKVEIKPCNE